MTNKVQGDPAKLFGKGLIAVITTRSQTQEPWISLVVLAVLCDIWVPKKVPIQFNHYGECKTAYSIHK